MAAADILNRYSATEINASAVDVRQLDATPLLTVYLGLLCFIPAVWVVPGLGAAGPPASLFGIAMFAAWCCVQLLPDITTRRTLMRWPLLLFVLVQLTTYAVGQAKGLSPDESLSADRTLLQILSIVGVFLMASEGLPTMVHLDRLTKRFVIMASIMGAIGVVQFATGFDPFIRLNFPGLSLNSRISNLGGRGGGPNELIRVKAGTLHPIEFAVAMTLALPLAFHHAFHELDRVKRNRYRFMVGLIAATALLAISRTAVLTLAGVGVVLFWTWSPLTRLRAAVVGVVFVFLVQGLFPGVLRSLLYLFTHLGSDSSISARTEDFNIVGPLIDESPWFGQGLGTFLPHENIILDNSYLYRIITTGYIGLMSWVLLLVWGLVSARHGARRHPNNRVRHMAICTAAMIFAGGLGGATFDLHVFPTASGFLTLALGLAATLGRMTPPLTSIQQPTPAGLLRPAYRVGHVKKPWWHRLDPELRNHR